MNQKIIFTVKLAVICFFNFLVVSPVFSETEIGIIGFDAIDGIPDSNGNVPDPNQIRNFEGNLDGRYIGTVGWYMGFSNKPGDSERPLFPLSDLEKIRNHDGYDTKIVPLLTWEPWGKTVPDALDAIVNTTHSDYTLMNNYIRGFAQSMKVYNDPIRLRFAHEMIQDDKSDTAGWYPWQDRADVYKAAFQHVHDIFYNEVDATNVQFVWSPNNTPSEFTTLKKYYPGADYVDWLGIDGYNRGIYGNVDGTATGQYFSDIFNNTYETFVTHKDFFREGGEEKKIMIAEFGTIEETGLPITKAQWIADAFSKIQKMEGIDGLSEEDKAKIAAFYWFNIKKTEQIGTNSDGTPINQEFDWRLNSSPESWNAFKTAMQDFHYTGHSVVPEPVSSVLFLLGAGALGSRRLLRKRRKV